jgi:hypothetical protein
MLNHSVVILSRDIGYRTVIEYWVTLGFIMIISQMTLCTVQIILGHNSFSLVSNEASHIRKHDECRKRV